MRHTVATTALRLLETKEQDMADSSFDIVSKIDRQEVANAMNQAGKEISQRYDFKGVGASIDNSGENIEIRANSEERALAVPHLALGS